MHAVLVSLICRYSSGKYSFQQNLCCATADEGLLVDQAVGKGAEELIGGVVLNQHPFAHCQCLSRGGCHNITFAGIDEHLHRTSFRLQTLAQWLQSAT